MPTYVYTAHIEDRHSNLCGYTRTEMVISPIPNNTQIKNKALGMIPVESDTYLSYDSVYKVDDTDMELELLERELMNTILGQCTEETLQNQTLTENNYKISCYKLPSGLWVYEVYGVKYGDKQIVVTAHKLNEEETSLLSKFTSKSYTHASLTTSFKHGSNIPTKRTVVMGSDGYHYMSSTDCHCKPITLVQSNADQELFHGDLINGTIQKLKEISKCPDTIKIQFINELEELQAKLAIEKENLSSNRTTDRRIVDKFIQDLGQRDSEISIEKHPDPKEIQSQSDASTEFGYNLSRIYAIDDKSYIVRCNLNSKTSNAITDVSELKNLISLEITILLQGKDGEDPVLLSKMSWSNLSPEASHISYQAQNQGYDVGVQESILFSPERNVVTDEELLCQVCGGITPGHIERVCESIQHYIALTKQPTTTDLPLGRIADVDPNTNPFDSKVKEATKPEQELK